MSRLVAALVLLVIAAAFASGGTITVLDGDTIKSGGITYRLVGFDTPETGERARCQAERTIGEAASRRLGQIIAAGVTLDPVPCACARNTEGTKACNYGRSCAVLRSQGRDVAEILIGEGLARSYVCRGTRCPRRGDWCGQ